MDPDRTAPNLSTTALSFGALGIVFGDIGTSPLYAMRESFDGGGHTLVVSETNVYGILSLILWSLLIVISVKYLLFVMRADNDGEGGILALTALVRPQHGPPLGRRRLLLLVGVFGTALLYGDAAITPAISVLAAVEGTAVASPALSGAAVPMAVAIIVAIFALQRRGTEAISRLFGPVMVTWFATLSVLGIGQIIGNPGVLAAVNPLHAVGFFADNAFTGFLALGAVFLVVTGGEALYADMGHFGRRPIQLAWFVLVFPALALNYFGQGALLLNDPAAIESPLFLLAPDWGLYPMVLLATAATIIASQALISGVFSVTTQAIQLGYAPRHRIEHTSAQTMGQVYLPFVNWVLMVACIGLVVGFGSSAALASAYGVAVTSTMAITTVLFYVVLRERFRWSRSIAVVLCGAFLAVDLAFLGANLFKIPTGGWFPVVAAGIMFTLMTTWFTGRRIVAERIKRNDLRLADYVRNLLGSKHAPIRTEGTAVYLFSTPGLTPPALIANVRHNGVLHEQLVVVSIVTTLTPRVLPARRSTVTDLGPGVFQVVLHYGFMEKPNVVEGLAQGAVSRLRIDPASTVFVLGAELVTISPKPGMVVWREHLFALLLRNATPAAAYFGIPPDRTITIAAPIEV